MPGALRCSFLGADDQPDRTGTGHLRSTFPGDRDLRKIRQVEHDATIGDILAAGVKQIGGAEELGDEFGGRRVVDILRRTHLLDPAFRHDDDLVGHRQGLGLVMGHEHRGHADALLDTLEFNPHVLAQIGVERRQRFIEQQHVRLDDDGAGERNALLLAAGEFLGIAPPEIGQLHQFERSCHLAPGVFLVDIAVVEPEGHILGHGLVRKQRVVLEHQAKVALVDRHIIDPLALDGDVPFGGIEQARDHAQGCGLAASGRPQKRDEAAFLDIQRHLVHGGVVAKNA